MDGSKINQKKKKGFTLIELLAVIAILAIVSVIVIFTATSVIGKARAKSYLASISNIEKNSSSYAVENNNSIRWISTDDNNGEYYCVTVKDLMDIGSFDKDVLESEIDKGVYVQESDYIYLERDVNTKTVTKSILIAGKNKDLDYCDDYKTDGIISFSTATGWSNNKDVVIDYYILNFKGNFDDYEYYYKREDTGEEVRNKFNNASSMSIKVEDFKAEEIIARIYYQNMKIVERTFRTKIDKVKPEIELLVNDGTSYKKGNDIYINLLDKDSGFKRGKHKVYYKWSLNELTCDEIISNGDYVELSVDANNLNKSNMENLYLTNNSGTGKIYACSDSVYDYVGNKLEGVYSADVYLDNDKPIVSLGNYTKDDKVYVSTTIELLVSDETSGIKDGSFTKEDLVVYVGDKILDTSNITLTKKDEEGRYELVINNKTEAGKVTVVVKENSVEDKVGNKNDEFTFKPEITFAVDTTPPTCTLSVTDSSGNVKITASSSDNDSGISYNGWSSSYSGDSSNTNTINKTGTYTYYVKDNAGNKKSCSVDISNIITNYSCPNSGNPSTGCYYTSSAYLKADGLCKCKGLKNKDGLTPLIYGSCTISGCQCVTGYTPYSNDCTVSCSYGSYSGGTCRISQSSIPDYSCLSGYSRIGNNTKFCYK